MISRAAQWRNAMFSLRRSICFIPIVLSSLAFSAAFQGNDVGSLPRIVRLEPGVLETMALVRKDPVLPPLSDDLKIEMNATLEVAVDRSGTVLKAKPMLGSMIEYTKGCAAGR
jgi:hypothetical protein